MRVQRNSFARCNPRIEHAHRFILKEKVVMFRCCDQSVQLFGPRRIAGSNVHLNLAQT